MAMGDGRSERNIPKKTPEHLLRGFIAFNYNWISYIYAF